MNAPITLLWFVPVRFIYDFDKRSCLRLISGNNEIGSHELSSQVKNYPVYVAQSLKYNYYEFDLHRLKLTGETLILMYALCTAPLAPPHITSQPRVTYNPLALLVLIHRPLWKGSKA